MLQSVFAGSNIKRDWNSKISEKNITRYKNGEIGTYDDRTLIYDVFLKKDNKTVVIVTPPLVNFRKVFLPMYLIVGREKKKFRQALNDRKVNFFELTLDNVLEKNTCANLMTPQGNFTVDLNVRGDDIDGPALVTLQKNNRIDWVRDWVDYYQTQFGIKHIYIYDNSSQNYKELCQALEGKATIIPWNFPYGPHYVHGNCFAQEGALNHFMLKYGHDCTIFNFDIDELLFCKNEAVKSRIMSRYYSRFDSYQSQPLLESTPANYSFKDLLFREKDARKCCHKYIVQGNIAYLRVHKVKFFHNRFFYINLFRLVRSFITKVFSGEDKGEKDLVSMEDAYFIHYTPITTSWKESDRARHVSPEELKEYKIDSLAEDVFRAKAE